MRGLRAYVALVALLCGLLVASPAAAENPTADYQPADYVVSVDGNPVDAEV